MSIRNLDQLFDLESVAVFGIIVRSELKGTGLGSVLMRKLISNLREHGTRRLAVTVLAENRRMLALAKSLGFVQHQPETADGTCEVVLVLQPAGAEEAGS